MRQAGKTAVIHAKECKYEACVWILGDPEKTDSVTNDVVQPGRFRCPLCDLSSDMSDVATAQLDLGDAPEQHHDNVSKQGPTTEMTEQSMIYPIIVMRSHARSCSGAPRGGNGRRV